MAKVITHDTAPRTVSSLYPVWSIVLGGAALGVLWWGLTAFFGYFIVDQLLCRAASTLASCSDSSNLAGMIATVVIALVGLGIMIRLRIFQPLIVVVAAAIALWDLAAWTHGLAWGEIVAWSALLYSLVYVLFTWLTRYRRTVPVLLMVTLSIAIIRIVLTM